MPSHVHAARRGLLCAALLAISASAAAALPHLSDQTSSHTETAHPSAIDLASAWPVEAHMPRASLPRLSEGVNAWPWNGTFFSGVFADHAVLQREPEKAAVYGVVLGGVSAATTVTVTVSETTATGKAASYTVKATVTPLVSPLNATWKAFLQPHANGGNITITAQCAGCANATDVATLSDVTFGDVLFCSGQSNMWLPMQYTLTRNRTYDNLDMYSNIRITTMANVALPDGYAAWVLPPPPPPNSRFWSGWWQPNATVLDAFSATCWYTAQELTDAARQRGETPPNFGLVLSAWGGTQIQVWQKNDTINAACTNATGGKIMNRAQGNGALWNGMVAPYLNMTVKAALWYQGENNVYECAGCPNVRECADFGPASCGSTTNHSGYACQMRNLISTWRQQWSVEPGTTDPMFPFGLVTLADGTSEGHGNNMANFRLAQTLGNGVLPSADMPNTFVALAHDAGDPTSPGDWRAGAPDSKDWQEDSPYQAIFDPRFMYSGPDQHATNFFMGPIHPRSKQTMARRLARAARAHIYGDHEVVWTGPILKNCSVDPARHGGFTVTLAFNETLLRSDAVHVWSPARATASVELNLLANCVNISDAPAPAPDLVWAAGPLCGSVSQALSPPVSPFEVQLNNSLWLPVPLNPTHGPYAVNGTKKPGFNVASATVPMLPLLSGAQMASVVVTGVRYAWSEAPCCPGQDRSVQPCPPNSCPIQTYNSTLPAAPFIAKVVANACECYAPQVCS